MFQSLANNTPAPNTYFMSYNEGSSDLFLNFYFVTNGGDRFFLEDEFTHFAPSVTTGETYKAMKHIEHRHQCQLYESKLASKLHEQDFIGERLSQTITVY